MLFVLAAFFSNTACTTGQLYYTDDAGNRKLACEAEFVGLPEVDKYAVEYTLSLCAKHASEKGYTLDEHQRYLIELDTTTPQAPCGAAWDHELAKTKYAAGELTAREYGYLVANIDLGLASVNVC